jgi:replicative DNA helicase
MKPSPQSQDAEKGFLSSVMQNISIIDVHVDVLKEALFFTRANRNIFKVVFDMWKQGSGVDLITVTEALSRNNLLDETGGPAYVADVYQFISTSANHVQYLNLLREKHTARLAISAANKIIDSAQDPALAGELSETVQKALVAITAESESASRIESIGEAAARRIDQYEKIFKNRGKLMGLTTGIKPLDEMTGGMKPGQLIVIGAPTKGGKTALAMNIAMRTSGAGNPVGIFSLEMSSGELVDRMVASFKSVDVSVLSRNPTKRDVEDISFGIKQISTLPIWIRDEGSVNPLQLRAAARRMVATHGIKLIIVDYIQLLEATDRKDSRERQVAECSRTMKQLAKELNVTVLALTQLNTDGASRESRAIEHDCDSMWIIEQDNEGRFCLNIKLARAHARGKIPLKYRSEYLRFDEDSN